MFKILTALVMAAIATPPFAIADKQRPSIDPLEPRMKAFERKIDFDKALLNHVATEKIVFDWQEIGVPWHLRGWSLVDKRHLVTTGELSREIWEWGYKHNKDGIDISVKSYKVGDKDALLAIRNFYNRSSMAEPPYKKGPANLGTISLALPSTYSYKLYWAYRDLEFEVAAPDRETALKTAYWLNSIAAQHRRPR